jgi:hypothetical protein
MENRICELPANSFEPANQQLFITSIFKQKTAAPFGAAV